MPLSQTVMLDIYPPALIPRVMSILERGGDPRADHRAGPRRLADRKPFLALGVLHQPAGRHPGLSGRVSVHGAGPGRPAKTVRFPGLRRPGDLRRLVPVDDGPGLEPGLVRLARDLDRDGRGHRRLHHLPRPDRLGRASVLSPGPGQGPQFRRLHPCSGRSSPCCCFPPAPFCRPSCRPCSAIRALQSGYASMPRGLGSFVAFLPCPA